MTSKLGHEPKINSQASVVTAGAARIVELVENGYTLLKP
jgi:intracellular sulfur oxidation DsrE/DsrF family protein